MSADTRLQNARDIELPRDERPWYLKRGVGANDDWRYQQKVRGRAQMRTSDCIPPTGHFIRRIKTPNKPQ